MFCTISACQAALGASTRDRIRRSFIAAKFANFLVTTLELDQRGLCIRKFKINITNPTRYTRITSLQTPALPPPSFPLKKPNPYSNCLQHDRRCLWRSSAETTASKETAPKAHPPSLLLPPSHVSPFPSKFKPNAVSQYRNYPRRSLDDPIHRLPSTHHRPLRPNKTIIPFNQPPPTPRPPPNSRQQILPR